MIKLDNNLLIELGLGNLPIEEKRKMLAHIYETLEMRVGTELANQMTDDQLLEFEEFIKRNDEGAALDWLEQNFPNYRDVVASEFQKLRGEIAQAAPQIAAGSGVALTSAADIPAAGQPPEEMESQPQAAAPGPVATTVPSDPPIQAQPMQQPAAPMYGQPAQPQAPQQPMTPPAAPDMGQQPPQMPGTPSQPQQY